MRLGMEVSAHEATFAILFGQLNVIENIMNMQVEVEQDIQDTLTLFLLTDPSRTDNAVHENLMEKVIIFPVIVRLTSVNNDAKITILP